MTIAYYYYFLTLHDLKQKPFWEGLRQTEQDESVRFNISLSSRVLWSVLSFPIVACFAQPWQHLLVTAEIQYIKRDAFGIFTQNNKDHWWGRLWGRGKSLTWQQEAKRRGIKRQSTQPQNKRTGSDSGKHTALCFFTQLMLSCSPTFKSS